MDTNEKLPPEILAATRKVDEMRRELAKYSKNSGASPKFPTTPYELTQNRSPEEEQIDDIIEHYVYVTLQNILIISENRLELAKSAGKLEDLKNYCKTVDKLFVAYQIMKNFTDKHSPIRFNESRSQRDTSLGIEHITSRYAGIIDCSQEPFSKIIGTLKPTNKLKRIGVYIRTGIAKIYDRDREPRVNIQVPVVDTVWSDEQESNIVTIRWDFIQSPNSSDSSIRLPVLDLIWQGMEANPNFENVGHLGGHHFSLGESLTIDEVSKILDRLNQYIRNKKLN